MQATSLLESLTSYQPTFDCNATLQHGDGTFRLSKLLRPIRRWNSRRSTNQKPTLIHYEKSNRFHSGRNRQSERDQVRAHPFWVLLGNLFACNVGKLPLFCVRLSMIFCYGYSLVFMRSYFCCSLQIGSTNVRQRAHLLHRNQQWPH